MGLVLEQKPLYRATPAAQEIIYVVSEDTNLVGTETRVKFTATIYVSQDGALLGQGTTNIGTVKATPNNSGVGMFDLRPILETYVSPTHLAKSANVDPTQTNASYKSVPVTDAKGPVPIHLIDRYSLAGQTIKWVMVEFNFEYFDATTGAMAYLNDFKYDTIVIFDGYLSNEDNFILDGNDFGYNLNLHNLILILYYFVV